jgi:putative redox protein
MISTRHVAHALGVTSDSSLQWRVDIRTGTHRLVADEVTHLAGNDAGPTPFGLLLSGLAACTAMTLRMYAAHKGWQLATIEVDVVYNIVDDGDGEQSSIVRTIKVPSEVPADQLASLAKIAERTPVTMVIRAGTPIVTTMRVLEVPFDLQIS